MENTLPSSSPSQLGVFSIVHSILTNQLQNLFQPIVPTPAFKGHLQVSLSLNGIQAAAWSAGFFGSRRTAHDDQKTQFGRWWHTSFQEAPNLGWLRDLARWKAFAGRSPRGNQAHDFLDAFALVLFGCWMAHDAGVSSYHQLSNHCLALCWILSKCCHQVRQDKCKEHENIVQYFDTTFGVEVPCHIQIEVPQWLTNISDF